MPLGEDTGKVATAGLLACGAILMVAALISTSSATHLQSTVSTTSTSGGVSVIAPKFSKPIPLPLTEAEARHLVDRMLQPTMQAEGPNENAIVAATTSTPFPVMSIAAFLVALLCGLGFRKPTTVAWSIAAAEGEKVDDDDFDAMVAKLKAKGQAKAAKAAVGFDKEVQQKKKSSAAAIKQVVVDEPESFEDEEVFAEYRPSPAELVVPAIGSLFIIGLIPLATGVVRQLWVRYKITSRRLCITSGWGGNEYTEVSFKKIKEMKYVRRNFGADGDLVMELVGGGAVDMQSVPNFVEVYNYIFDRISPDAQQRSMRLRRDA